MHNAQHLAASESPTKSSSSLSSASSELMSSCSSNGSAPGIKRRPHMKKSNSKNEESIKSNDENSSHSKNSNELPEFDIVPPNTLSLHSLCSTNNDSFLKDGNPFHFSDNYDILNNYDYCSFDSVSSSTNTPDMDSIDQNIDENTRNISKSIRIRIEKLILSYKEVTKQSGKVHFINDLIFNFDDNFTINLFEIFFTSNFKGKFYLKFFIVKFKNFNFFFKINCFFLKLDHILGIYC